MLTITMKSNIAEVTKRFRDLHQEQIPLAVAKALTFTAERVRDAERREMQRVFDRPTPFTLNSLYLRGATPARLEARVWFKDLRFKQHYLVPQVQGGDRPLKRFEKYLQDSGWLPRGMFVVPGSRADLDAYGNVSRGQLIKVLSALRALPQTGYLANRSAASAARRAKSKRPKALVNYFVGKPKPSSPDGIWERVGPLGLRPIFIFIRAPHYAVRFRFYEIAERTAQREFNAILEHELQRIRVATPLPLAA